MEEIVENFFNLEVLERSRYLLREGVEAMLHLVIVSFALALVLGAVFLAGDRARVRWVRWVTSWIVDVVRALPPLCSLVIVYYLTPPINGVVLTNFQAAVLTFGVVQGAYISEIYRGALRAVERGQRGQREAAGALGLGSIRTTRFVVAPQMLRVMIPPLTNQATQLVRDSSLAFFIGYQEIITRAKQASSLTSNSTPYIAAAAIYAVLLTALQLTSSWLERRTERAYR